MKRYMTFRKETRMLTIRIASVLMASTACGSLAFAASPSVENVHKHVASHGGKVMPSGAMETIQVSGNRTKAVHSQAATINVLSGAELRQLHLESPKDIAAFVPGVTAVNVTSGSTPIFSIRGVGLDDYSGTNMGGIGIYLDGVFSPYPEFYSGQMLDVQSVAVEKGPQGFDYGRSTTGGSMNVESVKPDNKFGGYVDWGYGSYNTNTGKFAVNVPITDHIFNRMSFSYTKGDGWQHDVHTNRLYGAQDILAIRNITKFEVDDRSSLLLNLHYTRNRGTPSSPQDMGADSLWGTRTGTIGLGSTARANAVNVGNSDVRRKEDGGGVSVTYDRDFSFGQFVSTTGIDFYRRDIMDNYDGEALHVGDDHWQDQAISQTHDMHLHTTIAQRLHLTVGVYESYDKIKGTYTNYKDLDFFSGLDPFAAGPATFAQHFDQQNVSTGAYVNTVTNIVKNLDFIASGRFSYDERGYRGGTVDINGSVVGAGRNISYIDENHTYERYTGRVGLRYRIRPGTFVYGTISNGYKAGSYFSAATTTPQALGYVRPENLIAYEVGVKGSLLHDKLQLEGSLFDYEYHNRQTLMLVEMPNTLAATLGSLPRARTRGGELSGTWHDAIIPNLDLNASFAYLDAKLVDTVTGVRGLSLYEPLSGGSALPFSPRFSWDAVARYKINLDRYMLSLQASYSWKDNMLVGLSDPNAKTSKISSLGLRMTFGPKTEKWSASVYVDNLTDNAGDTYSYTGNDGSRVQYIQNPRWVGCELHYKL